MTHTRIYAVILGLFLCCLTASAEKPRRAKGDRKAGVSTLPLGMAKEEKGKKGRKSNSIVAATGVNGEKVKKKKSNRY